MSWFTHEPSSNHASSHSDSTFWDYGEPDYDSFAEEEDVDFTDLEADDYEAYYSTSYAEEEAEDDYNESWMDISELVD